MQAHIINVEGYKAFCGIMAINHKNGIHDEVFADWLYKPEYNCWYGNGRSYPAEVCTIQEVC